MAANRSTRRKSTSPRVERALLSLAANYLESLVYEGILDPRGKSDDQLLREMQRLMRRESRRKEPVLFKADYTEILLRQARALSRDKYAGALAVALYGTYIEHQLNHTIAILAIRKGMRRDEAERVVRESLDAKTTWLLPLLGAPRLSSHMVLLIRGVADKRNEFLHYKWRATTEDKTFADPDVPDVVKAAERVVAYMRRYEARLFFGGQRHRMRRLLLRAARSAQRPRLPP